MNEMEQQCSLTNLDLQLFAEGGDAPASELATTASTESATDSTPATVSDKQPAKLDYSSMTPDQVSNLLTNYHQKPDAVADKVDQPDDKGADNGAEGKQDKTESAETDQTPDESGEQDADLQQVFKIKENGQVKEYTLAQLIDKAQKGENYERHMQDRAAQRKAYELAQQQQQKPPEPPKPEEKLKTLQQQVSEFAAQFQQEYGIPFNPYDPAHMAAFSYHQLQQAQEKVSGEQQQQAQLREYQTQETRYNSAVQTFAKEKDFAAINQYAEKALFLLPQKGPEGIEAFQKLYGTYQKIQQRDARYQQLQQTGKTDIQLQPFTADEVDELTRFYDNCKKEFYAKQFVPKTADKSKKPTQTEKPGTGESPASAKTSPADYAHMSRDDVNAVLGNYLSSQLAKKG